jgi:hypothetical protein
MAGAGVACSPPCCVPMRLKILVRAAHGHALQPKPTSIMYNVRRKAYMYIVHICLSSCRHYHIFGGSGWMIKVRVSCFLRGCWGGRGGVGGEKPRLILYLNKNPNRAVPSFPCSSRDRITVHSFFHTHSD